MSVYPFNSTVPTSTSVPSQDQSVLLTNAQSIQGLIAVDHVGFNTSAGTGGRHNQVTYNTVQVPAKPTDPTSVAYTANDSSGHPNQYFANSQSSFPMSAVKAFGMFQGTGTTGTVPILSSYNVNPTITKTTTTAYPIILQAYPNPPFSGNVVTGNNVAVFITCSSSSPSISYSFSSGVLTINVIPNGTGVFVSFLIMQA